MPHTKSAYKRIRQSKKTTASNRARKQRLLSLRRSLRDAAQKGAAARCQELFRAYCSALDKAARKGVITKNTANRHKSRAAARVKAANTTAPAQ